MKVFKNVTVRAADNENKNGFRNVEIFYVFFFFFSVVK